MAETNQTIDPDLIMISGPVNVVRLEGKIGSIKKVIYLFMDYHTSVSHQTQCSNIFSTDVQKYFVESFDKLSNANKSNRKYDFFAEIYPSELSDTRFRNQSGDFDSKEKYIEEVVKTFRKIFNYDPKRNKVSVNKLFKNIRLHFIDVREYYKHNMHSNVSEMTHIAALFRSNDMVELNDLQHIINILTNLKGHIQFIIEVLSNKKNSSAKPRIIKGNSRNIDITALEYLTNKIRNVYHHANVKSVMNKLINQSIDNFNLTIDEISEAIDEFNGYYHIISESDGRLVEDMNTTYIYTYGLSVFTIRQIITNISNKVDKIADERFVEFFARFTDIYFLRRFLDKDYITNAIVYTGALHSNTYIYALVKYFDFKVTHASYAKYASNMAKLNSEIKNKSLMEIQELFLTPVQEQCSNLTDFPSDFL